MKYSHQILLIFSISRIVDTFNAKRINPLNETQNSHLFNFVN